MSRKKIQKNDVARVYAWRKNNKESYNGYMKEYMRRWRAKQKSQSQNQDVTSGVSAHTSSESYKQDGAYS